MQIITKHSEVTMSKQTAVEWLESRITALIPNDIGSQLMYKNNIKKAKQMEKEQMKDVYLTHCVKAERLRKIFEQQFEQYYNETYGNNNE